GFEEWSVKRDSARLGFQTPPLWSAISQELEMRDQTKLFKTAAETKKASNYASRTFAAGFEEWSVKS
ncbi:hypothetical protein RJ45_09050, partial [Photobacterium gaetbulicola]